MKSSLESLSRRVRATRCATVSPTTSSSSSCVVCASASRRADPKRFQSVRPFRAEEEPPRERVRHRPPGANGHRTTNFATRRTTAKQSHAQEQTGWFEILSGNVDRMDFSDYLGQSDLAPEAEDEQNDTKSWNTG